MTRAAVERLYGRTVLEHGARPRNFRALAGATHHGRGDNPLCGDCIDIAARVEQGRLREVAFEGEACAIARASASLMTLAVTGCEPARARALLHDVERMLDPGASPDPCAGELGTLADLREFPARLRCAMLAWDGLRSILDECAPT
jgi:nitrogen fixation protein NifU and related proteins